MRLATRISGFEWLLVGLMVAVSALSIEEIQRESSVSARLIQRAHQRMNQVGRMKELLLRHEVASERYRLREGAPQSVNEARRDFEQVLSEALTRADRPEERALLEQVRAAAARYLQGELTVEAGLRAIDALAVAAEEEMNAARTESLARGRTGITLIAIGGAFALLCAIVLAARASQRITQPVGDLHRVLVSLVQGNLDARVPDGEYDETLREMGQALNMVADRVERSARMPDLERNLLQAATEHLLGRDPRPLVVVDLAAAARVANGPGRDELRKKPLSERPVRGEIAAALEREAKTAETRLVGDGENDSAEAPVKAGREPGDVASGDAHSVDVLRAGRGTIIGFLVQLPAPAAQADAAQPDAPRPDSPRPSVPAPPAGEPV